MPSIAVFVHDLSATGVVRNALAIAGQMQRAGWRTTVVTYRAGGTLAAVDRGIDLVSLDRPQDPRVGRKLQLLWAVPRLRRVLRQADADILLSAGNHAHLTCWLATRGMSTPARVYRVSNKVGYGQLFSKDVIKVLLRRLRYRLFLADAAKLVLVSPALAANPQLGAAARDGKAVILRNGVDVARIRRLASEPCDHPWFDDPTPVVVSVGRLAPQKNLGRLIEAIAIARRTRPVRLLLIGAGPAAVRRALERQADRLGVSEFVSLMSATPNPFPFMKRADAFALVSLWEGSPNVLLEALACDVPCLASGTAGNAAEILADGRHGLVVDPQNVEAIAEAVLCQLDPARRVMPAGRAEAFDQAITLAGYQDLFTDLMQTAAPQPQALSSA